MASPTDMSYLEVLFSTYGFHALAVSISSNLDYFSSVQLKRCSRVFYEFFRTKEPVLKQKLMDEWRDHFSNDPQPKLNKSFEFAENAKAMHFIDAHTLAVAHEDKITLVDIDSGALVTTLEAGSPRRRGVEGPAFFCFQASSSHLFASLDDDGVFQLCVFDLRLRKLVHRQEEPELILVMKLVNDNLLITGYDTKLGTILVRDVSDVHNNMTVVAIFPQPGPSMEISQLDAINDTNRVLIAFAVKDLNQETIRPRLRVIELGLPSGHHGDQLPSSPDQMQLSPLTGFSRKCRALGVKFLDSNRLAVTDENACLIIFIVGEELSFTVQRVIELPLRTRPEMEVRGVDCMVVCFGGALDDLEWFSDDPTEPDWVTDLMLFDIDVNNKDYQRNKKKYKGKGILKEKLRRNDSRMLWNQKSIDGNLYVNSLNARYLGYIVFGKVIVHDVLGPK